MRDLLFVKQKQPALSLQQGSMPWLSGWPRVCLTALPCPRPLPCRYIASNPQYADSAAYAGRMRQLQARAMAAVRTKVQQVLRHATDQARLSVLSLTSPGQTSQP